MTTVSISEGDDIDIYLSHKVAFHSHENNFATKMIGFQLSNEIGATTYPFLAVLCYNHKSEPTVVDTIEGVINVNDLLSRLSSLIDQHSNSLQTLKQQR